MQSNGDHGAESEREVLRDGCSQRNAVGKVVDGIASDYYPCQRSNSLTPPRALLS